MNKDEASSGSDSEESIRQMHDDSEDELDYDNKMEDNAESDDDNDSNDEDEESESDNEDAKEAIKDVSESSESEEEDNEEDRTVIRKELSTLSFEELEALKTRIGTKEWNEAMFGTSAKVPGSVSTAVRKGKRKDQIKRTNKHRPRELSSKAKVPRVRKVVPVIHKKPVRDPRFENLCGEYDEQLWERNYDFIGELRKKEIDELKQKLKDERDPQKKADIRQLVQQLMNKEKNKEVKREKAEKFKKQKEENIQRLKEGKKPYFMKKTTSKYVDLLDKYDKLKESGKLEAYLKKKRKKNATRDRKALPTTST